MLTNWSNWTLPPNTTQVPIPAIYNCGITQSLPFGGAEILILACVFLWLAVMVCVSFIDLAAKQTWPSKFLSSSAQKRIADLQVAFPNIDPKGATQQQLEAMSAEEAEHAKLTTKTPTYDGLVNQAPYIASLTIDDDIVEMLANGGAFSTVSVYCSSTVRGFAMLTGLLLTTGITISFLWCHNAMVYPASLTYASYASVLGYCLIFLTGLVMCGPSGRSVHRNANICLWGNIPTNSKLLNLHEVGVISFVLLPWLAHLYTIATVKDMPNQTGAIVGCAAQLIGALVMLAGNYAHKIPHYTTRDAACVMIIGEILCVFSSFIAYVQYEFYATAVCAKMEVQFNIAIYAAVFGPMAIWIKKTYSGEPKLFYAAPSVLLTQNQKPVAMSGPAPALAYDQSADMLPRVGPPE